MCQVHEKVGPQVQSRDRYLVTRVNLQAPPPRIIMKGVRNQSFGKKFLPVDNLTKGDFFTILTSLCILLVNPFFEKKAGSNLERREFLVDEEGKRRGLRL